MLFQINHESTYRYSEPVFLEPHHLRFHPRSDGSQSLEAFELIVTPEPAGRTDQLDADGNSISFVWFDGVHDELTVRARARVETRRENPFDFLLPPENRQLSQLYTDAELIALQPALARLEVQPDQDSVQQLAVDLVDETEGQVFDFLQLLNQTLHERVELCHRELGEPYSPAQTLALRRGACRDLAVLYADACRSVGLAARFTSGYHLGSDREDEHDLHAWTEVYIPNAGWRGFDPSSGLLAADCHIPVASSAHHSGSAPIVGSYRSSTAANTLQTQVQVSALAAVTFEQLNPSA